MAVRRASLSILTGAKGNQASGPPWLALGGTVTDAGGFRVHAFETVGNYTFSVPTGLGAFEYLLIAGGGGAGMQSDTYPGGGGAGGYLAGVMSGVAGRALAVTIGIGGDNSGAVGSKSVLDYLTAFGGGGGYNAAPGGNGGSGGGGAGWNSTNVGGSGMPDQGNHGGTGSSGGIGGYGGGAGTPGSGTGGLYNSITGTAIRYCNGGHSNASAGATTRGTGGHCRNVSQGISGALYIRYALAA